VATALAARDRSDRTRAAAPLVRAADAVAIDTTGLAIQDVIDEFMRIVHERQASGRSPSPGDTTL
jgi:cytidylate kinase